MEPLFYSLCSQPRSYMTFACPLGCVGFLLLEQVTTNCFPGLEVWVQVSLVLCSWAHKTTYNQGTSQGDLICSSGSSFQLIQVVGNSSPEARGLRLPFSCWLSPLRNLSLASDLRHVAISWLHYMARSQLGDEGWFSEDDFQDVSSC